MYNRINKTVNASLSLANYVKEEDSDFIDFWEEFEKKDENLWKIHDFIKSFWSLESLDPLEVAVLNALSPDMFRQINRMVVMLAK